MTRFKFARLLAVSQVLFSLALPVAARAETQWFSLKGEPAYADLKVQLLALVNVYGFHADNNFCVVGQRDDDGEIALIYWPTENQLYYWNPKVPDQSSLLESQSLDLNKDVVATANEQGTSMVLVTKAYIDDIIQSCNRYGNHYYVRKSDSGWASPQKFKQFLSLQTQLQNLLSPPAWLIAADPGTVRPKKQLNKFCVITQQDKTWLAAYVYWETEKRLILWIPKKMTTMPLSAHSAMSI